MKKIISLLLCFALLFSFTAFASAKDAPQLNVFTSKNLDDNQEAHYCFSLAVKNCTYFESLELLITYNPEVLEYSKVFPYVTTDDYKHPISCTVETDGRLRLTVYNPDPIRFGHIEKIERFCFNFIGAGSTGVSVELVSFRTAAGEVEDIGFETSIENFTATAEAPKLMVKAFKDNTAWTGALTAKDYVCFNISVKYCPDFESFTMRITYNPDVLQFVNGYPFPLDDELRKQTICTVSEPGVLQVTGNNNDCGNQEFDPFCLKVIGAGDTNISVELLSFKTADGEVENVKFDASVLNFTATRKDYTTPTVCITAQDAVSFSAQSQQRIDCLVVSIPDVADFTRCEINVALNTPPYSQLPIITDLASSNSSTNCKSGIQKQQDGSYTITLNAPVENADIPYAAFTFKSNEDVPLAFTVNSVNLYTADGEIAKNDFILDEQRLNGAGDFVRYDLDGDDRITAEDARLALRFAVGIATATDEQCRAVGVANAKSFTSEDARFILRAAVGLEDDVAKVVTEVYWQIGGLTGYIVYIYSDGSYDTIGPLDVNDRPDWI